MALVMMCCTLMSACMPKDAHAADIFIREGLIADRDPDGSRTGDNNDTSGNKKEQVTTSGTADKVTGKQMKLSKKSRMNTEEMTSGYNRFAMKALKQAIGTGSKKGGNMMISPASLMFALDMAAMGAKGKTYKQIARLFTTDSKGKKYPSRRDLADYAEYYTEMLENSAVFIIGNRDSHDSRLLFNGIQNNFIFLFPAAFALAFQRVAVQFL